ncbi:hypothetical protein [Flavobacterium sp.]|uniref:hypothetical protein n=1 Tax=Flavobacterium sp. TaxID=239 RepID=UPI0025BC0D65|nr:hypothetical protein [Flavobacterium sp.]MBA4155756.1 hypothetical protein [Flavobacterium sp.]
MKYFDEKWCFSTISDDEIDARLMMYKQYVDSIYNEIPFVLKLFAKSIFFHDGIIDKIVFSQNNNYLKIHGVFGDLLIGYYFLEINYKNVCVLNEKMLDYIFKNKNKEVLSNEIEVLINDRYAHRFFFSDKTEIEIVFEDVDIKIENTHQRSYKRSICDFEIT